MATKLFIRSAVPSTQRATNDTGVNSSSTTAGWDPLLLSTTAGSGVISRQAVTATGPTSGIEIGANSSLTECLSEPLAADVTFAPANVVTFNLWMAENNMSANVAAQCIVDILKADGTIGSTIINSEQGGTELAVTTRAAVNWTGAPSAVTANRGDRIRVRVLGNDAGTMATGFTFNLGYSGASGGADGDSWIQFVENLTFETTAPTGTVLYLTNSAASGGINPGAATEKEAWTSRGAGVVTGVVNTVAGWTPPVQMTDTAGGTAIEWYTRPLTAFTLGGLVQANISGLESNASANCSWRLEIAVCANDGTGATVWASGASYDEPLTSESALTVTVAGDDTAITNGQRLRIRIYIDDSVATFKMATGFTATIDYAGTSGGASGDTFVTLPQSVTEFVTAATATFRPSVVMAPYIPA